MRVCVCARMRVCARVRVLAGGTEHWWCSPTDIPPLWHQRLHPHCRPDAGLITRAWPGLCFLTDTRDPGMDPANTSAPLRPWTPLFPQKASRSLKKPPRPLSCSPAAVQGRPHHPRSHYTKQYVTALREKSFLVDDKNAYNWVLKRRKT